MGRAADQENEDDEVVHVSEARKLTTSVNGKDSDTCLIEGEEWKEDDCEDQERCPYE